MKQLFFIIFLAEMRTADGAALFCVLMKLIFVTSVFLGGRNFFHAFMYMG